MIILNQWSNYPFLHTLLFHKQKTCFSPTQSRFSSQIYWPSFNLNWEQCWMNSRKISYVFQYHCDLIDLLSILDDQPPIENSIGKERESEEETFNNISYINQSCVAAAKKERFWLKSRWNAKKMVSLSQVMFQAKMKTMYYIFLEKTLCYCLQQWHNPKSFLYAKQNIYLSVLIHIQHLEKI